MQLVKQVSLTAYLLALEKNVIYSVSLATITLKRSIKPLWEKFLNAKVYLCDFYRGQSWQLTKLNFLNCYVHVHEHLQILLQAFHLMLIIKRQ